MRAALANIFDECQLRKIADYGNALKRIADTLDRGEEPTFVELVTAANWLIWLSEHIQIYEQRKAQEAKR